MRTRVIGAVQGRSPFSLVIRNVRIVNVFDDTVTPGDIALMDGRIAYVGAMDFPHTALEELDGAGCYALPGFVDSHMHLESSMLTPAHFARVALCCGTTTVAADPHEIGNVLGRTGVQALMDAVPAGRIAKGAAYYKGAYILPFAAAGATSSLNLTVKLTGKGDDGSEDASGSLAQERILTVSGVKAEENKVTVVTFKYRASSDKPDDEENVFTPSIKYTVTIQTQWNGIVEGPSVDI